MFKLFHLCLLCVTGYWLLVADLKEIVYAEQEADISDLFGILNYPVCLDRLSVSRHCILDLWSYPEFTCVIYEARRDPVEIGNVITPLVNRAIKFPGGTHVF